MTFKASTRDVNYRTNRIDSESIRNLGEFLTLASSDFTTANDDTGFKVRSTSNNVRYLSGSLVVDVAGSISVDDVIATLPNGYGSAVPQTLLCTIVSGAGVYSPYHIEINGTQVIAKLLAAGDSTIYFDGVVYFSE